MCREIKDNLIVTTYYEDRDILVIEDDRGVRVVLKAHGYKLSIDVLRGIYEAVWLKLGKVKLELDGKAAKDKHIVFNVVE